MNLVDLLNFQTSDPKQMAAAKELAMRGITNTKDVALIYGEPALMMFTSMAADALAGYLGGLSLAVDGPDAAARDVKAIQELFTYQPKTPQGKFALEAIGGSVIGKFGEWLESKKTASGEYVLKNTGSEALAAIGFAAPEAAMELPFLKILSQPAKYAKKVTGALENAAKVRHGQLNMFAGPTAKTADIPKMKAAQELAKRGVSRDEIWQKTGWFNDVDGNWKFEIDDSGYSLPKDGVKDVIDYGARKQGAAMRHDALFKSYPELEGVIVRGGAQRHTAMFDPDDNVVKLDTVAMREAVSRKKIAPDSLKELESVNLHEMQHATQGLEGFAKGGSPASFVDDIKALNELNQMSFADMDDFQKTMFKELRGKYGKSKTEFDIYQRLAGEAEARNVQTRMDYTPDQRAANPPWKTLDVPEDELIVRTGEGGVAMSEAPKKSFSSTTGDISIDEKISNVVDMSPDEYLQRAYDVTDGRLGGDFQSWLNSNAVSPEKMQGYARDMAKGDQFPMPWIDEAIGSQDGRNRALAAKQAGINKIPVGIIEQPPISVRIAELKAELKTAKGYSKAKIEGRLNNLLEKSATAP